MDRRDSEGLLLVGGVGEEVLWGGKVEGHSSGDEAEDSTQLEIHSA